MTPATSHSDFDAEGVRDRYRAERDKRLVPGRTDTNDLRGDPRLARFTADPFTPPQVRAPINDDVNVVIVGAGIAGLVAGARLREAGVRRIRLIDTAGGVGGTWYWNRYPGVMCDVESTIYLPMLEEMGYLPRDRYASGQEIREYLESLADRFELTDDALFHTSVNRAEWDHEQDRWVVVTDRGDRITSQFYVLAVGMLNLMKMPAIPGMDDFAGHAFHTARWDYAYTGGGQDAPMTGLADKVVGLIGTGATGVQCLAPLARDAKQVVVFQRTPSAIGARNNGPLPADFAESCQPGWQAERMDNFQAILLGRDVEEDLIADGMTQHLATVHNPPFLPGMSFDDFIRNSEAVDFAIMEEHRQRVDDIVRDPATAAILQPHYRYLCKRPCFHDEFLPAFNEPNVTLVDCPAGFDSIGPDGPIVGGVSYPVDCLIYGTGFEPELTPLPTRAGQTIVGRDGTTLADKWNNGAATLFGMMTHGFPNLFMMPAPGQQAVVTVNFTQVALLGAELIAATVHRLREHDAPRFEVTAAAEAAWTQRIVDSWIDVSSILSACTPSRINNEGAPEALQPRDGNLGHGYGDFFAYRETLQSWMTTGADAGLEIT